MPIDLIPTDVDTRLTAVGTGNVTLEDLKTFVANVRTDERRRLQLFVDLSEASTDMVTSDVKIFASLLAAHTKQKGARGRVAVFAPSDGFYGVLRMLMSYCEIVGVDHVAVFRSRPEAEAWLG